MSRLDDLWVFLKNERPVKRRNPSLAPVQRPEKEDTGKSLKEMAEDNMPSLSQSKPLEQHQQNIAENMRNKREEAERKSEELPLMEKSIDTLVTFLEKVRGDREGRAGRKERPELPDRPSRKDVIEGAQKERQKSLDRVRRPHVKEQPKKKGFVRPVTPPSEIPLMIKEGGAGGAGDGGGLTGGGTVAVASDPGVFTPTYGGDSKKRLGMKPENNNPKVDKSRTSGVTKVDRFLRGEKVNQSRKSIPVQDFATWVVDEVRKALDPTKRRPGVGNVPPDYVDDPPTGKKDSGPPRNPWGRGGKMKPAKGQQFLTDFMKMENISRVLETEGSVMSLMKAIDIDIPVK